MGMHDGMMETSAKKTTCPLLKQPTPQHPVRWCQCQLWGVRSGAAGGEDGHLAEAAISALQQHRAVHGVRRGENGCVDTT